MTEKIHRAFVVGSSNRSVEDINNFVSRMAFWRADTTSTNDVSYENSFEQELDEDSYENSFEQELKIFNKNSPLRICRVLFEAGCSTEMFSNEDFRIMSITRPIYFDFMDTSHLADIIESLPADRLGKLFAYLIKISLNESRRYFDKVASGSISLERRPSRPFETWLDYSRKTRKDRFNGLVELMVNHPNTPIELLEKLI